MTIIALESKASGPPLRAWVAILCVLLILPGGSGLLARQAQPASAPEQEAAAKLPPEQLDSLVAPIALYPDPMLTQTLVASTYPLEIIQLQQWLEKNKGLKDQALVDAVKKQDWDPSIMAMASLPDVVKNMAENIKWTSDLGNAFLAQQEDVMDSVQRMRKKAKDAGALKTTEQQKVETQVVETKTVVVIQQANPQVVYVPTYNPVVVYGPPVYPYPPIVYPPPPPPGAVAAGMMISFGVGMAMGAAYHGGWGYNCGWGHNDVNINVNNNYNVNRNTNINRSGNTTNIGNTSNTWQHNPQHRGGAPYSNQATASKYGGTARGQSASSRQATTGQTSARTGGGAQAGTASGSRGSSAGNMSAGASRGGGDQVGSRQVSGSGGAGGSGAFGGASGGASASSARASSQRGASSTAASRGGGGRSGGGGGRRR